MQIDVANPRVIALGVLNLPILVLLARVFFSTWSEFFSAFIPSFELGLMSWIRDRHTRLTWDNLKLIVFLLVSGLMLYGEYQFFFPKPSNQRPPSAPSSNISIATPNHSMQPTVPLRGPAADFES